MCFIFFISIEKTIRWLIKSIMIFRLQSVITRTICALFLSYFICSRLFILLTGMPEDSLLQKLLFRIVFHASYVAEEFASNSSSLCGK